MSSDDPKEDNLARAARLVARGPAPLVAGLVEAWRRAFPDEDPAAALRCSPRTISELSLCLRPREERWIDDSVEIAGSVGIEPDRLISFLRAAEAIERFGNAHPADDTLVGRLLAARDRDEGEE